VRSPAQGWLSSVGADTCVIPHRCVSSTLGMPSPLVASASGFLVSTSEWVVPSSGLASGLPSPSEPRY